MILFKNRLNLFILLFLLFYCLSVFLPSLANNNETNSLHLFKGYITNKNYNPIKLKVSEIDKTYLYSIDRNLDDNSFPPSLNLKITAENTSDYSLTLNENTIFIPSSTRFIGHISEITPSKNFNKRGFFKVTFDQAVCPDGQTINLKSNIVSRSENHVYNPFRHLGKTTLSLVGGSLAGALFTYQLGGLGLALATHGYSLAGGAAIGGFIGTVAGVSGKGKEASIEPGSDLKIIPVDEISLVELKQVTCKNAELKEMKESVNPESIKIEILSIKEKKELLGESLIKIDIQFTNNSNEYYRLSNFFLRDSQGKEYTTSAVDFDQDIFIDFPPKNSRTAKLEFFVDHPKASHWLVLKNKTFSEDVGSWKIKG